MGENRLKIEAPDRSSSEQLSRMIAGARIAPIIAVAAELGIPDLLKGGPRTADELAGTTGAHAPTLRRLMRALDALGLIDTVEEGYVLTALGAALRSDCSDRLDLFARYIGSEANWRTWGNLKHSVRTGEAAFPDLFGMTRWEYAERHPEFGDLFDALMSSGSLRRQEAILDAYDFSRFGTVVDVAGGHGQLLGAILQRYPGLRGVLFDQTHVVAGAAETLAGLGVADRVTTVGGTFFETLPRGGDAYLLKFILHDWDDSSALAILQSVGRAAAPGATLLVVDRVLPEDGSIEANAAIMDLHMLVNFAGKERTEREFQELYERAGFRLSQVIPTAGDVSLVEGVRV